MSNFTGILPTQDNMKPYQSWCSVGTFPWYCTGDGVGSGVVAGDNGSRTSFNECSLGSEEIANFQQKVALYLFLMYVVVLMTIILSMVSIMILIVRRHFLLKRFVRSVYGPRLARSRHGDNNYADRQREGIIQEAERNRKVTNVILVQCIAYVFACLAIQVFPTLNFNVSKAYELYSNNAYTVALMIIFPLQGLFNFIIFISHKMYNLSFVNSEQTTIQRFKEALMTREHPIIVLSNVSLISSQENEEGNDSPAVEEGFDPDLSYDQTRSNNGPGASRSELLSVGTKKDDDAFVVNSTSESNVDSNALSVDDVSRSRKSVLSGGMFSYFTSGSKSGHDDVSKAVSSL